MKIYDQIGNIKRVQKPTYVIGEYLNEDGDFVRGSESELNPKLAELYESISNALIVEHTGKRDAHRIMDQLIRVILEKSNLINEIRNLADVEVEDDWDGWKKIKAR